MRWRTLADNLTQSIESRLISFIGRTRWHKHGPSAFAYVTTKCADYYREAEESEVSNYLRSSPRHFFVGIVLSKRNLRRILRWIFYPYARSRVYMDQRSKSRSFSLMLLSFINLICWLFESNGVNEICTVL